MKINKKYLLIRILTFPIKLIFTLLWNNVMGLWITFRWILFGGQEILYGNTQGKDSIVKLIEQNEEILKRLKSPND